jgi:tRNA threonylcarbamoyladenosine biosynthesis protein TsaB
MIISFDTSTAIAGVALYGEGGLIAEATWRSHRDQTAQLLPMAHRLLELQSMQPDALTGVAVALGPGSFNGLRVGVSTAKGLCLALGLPIFGVSSLDIVALQHTYLNGNLCTLIEAGRGRLGVGWYKVRSGNWKRQGEYENLTAPELAAKISAPTTIIGELTPDQRKLLQETLGKNAQFVSAAMGLRRVSFLAEWAWNKLQAGEKGDDLASLQPLYLHQPVKQ